MLTHYMPDHFWWQDRNWGMYHLTLTRESWKRSRERFLGVVDVQRQYEELAATLGRDGETAGG